MPVGAKAYARRNAGTAPPGCLRSRRKAQGFPNTEMGGSAAEVKAQGEKRGEKQAGSEGVARPGQADVVQNSGEEPSGRGAGREAGPPAGEALMSS